MDPILSQVRKAIAIEKNLKLKHNKHWELSWTNSEYKFSYIGKGAFKLVFQVQHGPSNLDWVFCFPHNPKSKTALRDLTAEVDTLRRLGNAEVVVPLPFRKGTADKADLVPFRLLNRETGEDNATHGFFLQYLDKDLFDEMEKKNADKQARGNWLQGRIEAHKPGSVKNIHATIKSFEAIRDEWSVKIWGDFQVVYDRTTGELMVIDPNNETKSASDTDFILKTWGKYLQRYA